MVSLDGVLEEKPRAANKHLAAFLRKLPVWTVTPLGEERRARILDMADRASRVVGAARTRQRGAVPRLRGSRARADLRFPRPTDIWS